MKSREKKLIVVLSGGGAKTAFQVGAWNNILNNGINLSGTHSKNTIPHAVFGVSGGAINGVMMAMGKNKELMKFWNYIAGRPQEVYSSEFLKVVNEKVTFDFEALIKYGFSDLGALEKGGLLFKKTRKKIMEKVAQKLLDLRSFANNDPLFNKIRSLTKLEDIKSEVFQSGCVSLTDGAYHAYPHTDYVSDAEFQKSVIASSCIPGVWSPIPSIKNKHFEITQAIDGGIRNLTPLGDAIKYISESDQEFDYHFLIMTCHPNQLQSMTTKPSLFKIAARGIYDVALDEIRDTDLKEFLRINDLVKQAKIQGLELKTKSGRVLRDFKVKIINPTRELGFALDFSRSAIMDSFAQGFHRSKEVLNNPSWE